MEAYWQDDHAAVSVNSVCVLAGVSKPSLYREFGSEDGLTAAVLEHYAENILGQIDELLLRQTSFREKLDAMISFVSEDPQMQLGCLFIKMRTSRSRFGKQTQAKLFAIESHFAEAYTRFFREGGMTGEWSGRVSSEFASIYLLEQLSLAVSQRAAGKSPELVRELLELAVSALLK